MKKLFTSLLFIVLVSPILNAQTMHTLIFVNTQEPKRQIDRTADYNDMTSFLGNIARAIGYTNDMRAHKTPQDFTKTMVEREIDNLSVGSNDIVIFYYSGHGGNMGDDKWPHIQLKDGLYWQSDIVKRLNSKCANAMLIMCIADCCNNTSTNSIPGNYNPKDVELLRKLFTNFQEKTTIVMSASKQGQYSWSHTQYGAYFGNCLRIAIAEKTSNKNANAPTWNTVFDYAKQLTLQLTNQKQEPQCMIYNRNGFKPHGSF